MLGIFGILPHLVLQAVAVTGALAGFAPALTFAFTAALAPGAFDDPVTLVVEPSARVAIPGGGFPMGASADELRQARALCTDELRGGGALMLEVSPRCNFRFDSEGLVRRVTLPAFTIDRTEVTVGAYQQCVRARACPAVPAGSDGDGDGGDAGSAARLALPVEAVTFAEAEGYCRHRGGRLPTEAEWEKAARGVTTRDWPWGEEWLERRANHGRAERLGPGAAGAASRAAGSESGSGGVADDTTDSSDGFVARAPVGSFPAGASPYGVLDMAGNVWEWTADYFGREPPQNTTRFDPRGPVFASERTIRGGGYRSPPSDLRVTRRVGLHPDERVPGVGFRCAYDGKSETRAAPAPRL